MSGRLNHADKEVRDDDDGGANRLRVAALHLRAVAMSTNGSCGIGVYMQRHDVACIYQQWHFNALRLLLLG